MKTKEVDNMDNLLQFVKSVRTSYCVVDGNIGREGIQSVTVYEDGWYLSDNQFVITGLSY